MSGPPPPPAPAPAPASIGRSLRAQAPLLAIALALLMILPVIPGVVGPAHPNGAPRAVPLPGPTGTGAWPTASRGPSASLSTWTNLTPLPESLQHPSMTYDPADGYVLLFGGLRDNSTPTNDTWIFQHGAWKNLTPTISTSPSARWGMALSYDSADGYVVGYGGSGWVRCGTTDYCNDTWSYLHGVWTQLNPRCDYPGIGYGACDTYLTPRPAGDYVAGQMVDDLTDGYVLLYSCGLCQYRLNGEDWTFSGDTWTWVDHTANGSGNLSMIQPTIGSIAYDPSDGYVIGYGGVGGEATTRGAEWGNVTWRWNGIGWVNESKNLTVEPPARFGEPIVTDVTDNSVMLYGGWNFSCAIWGGNSCSSGTNLYLNDTWMFHSGAWSAVAATPNPGHRYSYVSDDPADGGVALYGGIVCVTGCNFAPSEMQWTDTWLWSAAPPLSDVVALAAPATSEVGLSINFSVSYRGGVPPTTVQWGFDDGTTGTGASLSHAFHTAGLHAVSVWINDSYGHRTRSFANVSVSSGFAVAPSASVNPGDAGTPITFAANPSGGGATTPTFNWTFGDGSTGTTSAPVHTYATAGNYTVTLNATDSLGVTATGSVLLHVHSALRIVRLNVTPTPVVLGIPENFSTVLSGGTTPFIFAWVFGDGGIGGSLPNITHIYTTNGPFVATVQVTDGAGASISSFLNLSIALAASVSANGSIGAAPLLLAFTPNVTGGIPTYSYAWNFGDGQTSVLPAPTHLFGSVGAYNVTLTVRDRAGHSAQGLWGLEVFTGQGALQLQVGVSAPVLTVGQSSTLTAEPHGGVGRYVYQWSSVPTGCREVSLLVLSCAPSTNGTYAASGTLTDGAGTIVTASGTFKVGSGGNPPLTAPSELLGPWLYPALLILVVAILAMVGGSYVLRRRGRPPTIEEQAVRNERYAAYRVPLEGDASAPENSPPDPLGDMF